MQIFLLVHIQSILNTKPKKKNTKIFGALNIIRKNLAVFRSLFLAPAITSGIRQFFGDLFSYFKRVSHLLPCLQVSYGVLGNFFPTNWPWSKKTRGSWGKTPFLLLEKLSYIMKIMPPPKKPSYIMKIIPPPKKPFLDWFPSFFFC